MGRIDERIIKYLEGEMNENELSSFEEELKNSLTLKEQLVRLNRIKERKSEVYESSPGEEYFNGIVPRFRTLLDAKRRKTRKLKWSLSLSSVSAVILTLLLILPPREKSVNMEMVLQDMDRNDLAALVEKMNVDVVSPGTEIPEVLKSEYYDEIQVSAESPLVSDIFSSGDIYASLSDEEAEKIFNELINKEFIR